MVYGRPAEVQKHTVLNSESLRKKSKSRVAVFGACWCWCGQQQRPMDAGRTSRGGGRHRLACRFPRQSKRSCKEQRERAGGAAWASACSAVVLSAIWNLSCRKSLRAGGPKYRWLSGIHRKLAAGDEGGVRKAGGGPKEYDL